MKPVATTALAPQNVVQWNIYEGDEKKLGPASAYEIRLALRQGQISFKHFAGRSNSLIRLPILEIDEIFDDRARLSVGGLSNKKFRDITNGNRFVITSNRSRPDPVQKNPPLMSAKNASTEPVKEKLYFLRDRKGRMLGPMDSDEVLQFAAKGKNLKNVKVLKRGVNASIPLERFVSQKTNEKQQSQPQNHKQKEFHPLTNLSEGLPSSRVIEELATVAALRRIKGSNTPLYFLIAGVISLLILSVLLAARMSLISLDGVSRIFNFERTTQPAINEKSTAQPENQLKEVNLPAANINPQNFVAPTAIDTTTPKLQQKNPAKNDGFYPKERTKTKSESKRNKSSSNSSKKNKKSNR